ncbi:hypothetical protein E4T44_03567 [Aureobasidium sp. EXF-8845]|nr:hypothetical protein E4T44_03567 [Aureobasidium sp. EXF-8845]KAI4853918.1 hypothetical protein E4T45_04133 [Aureobasidium sp. EXF-8846]
MLTYVWLLLPMLAQAAHHIPRHHARRSSLKPHEDASSTASSMVWPTDTGPAVLSDPISPCKRVFLATKSTQDQNGESEKRVPAELAYECLNSIPFNQSAAAALMESMRPYLDWHSTTSYVKDPPEKYAKYIQPPYNFWSAFDAVEANVAHGAYDSEYDFGWDLYQITLPAHDGHFNFIPDVVVGLFHFGRTTAIVSVSEDGKDLPLVYAYADILESYAGNSSFEPSHIVQIDGRDTTDFLLDWSDYGSLQDKDALWNDLFYSLAQVSLGAEGAGPGMFAQNRLVYPGATTTLTFANGTNVTDENFARFSMDMSHIESGADMYQEFLSQSPEAYRKATDISKMPEELPYLREDHEMTSSQRHTQTVPAIGYPSPIFRQKQNMNGGYFLEGPGFEDVAVLTAASFGGRRDAQKINTDFIAAAVAANKTKLIVDVSANPGGFILQGYDLFKQLFPSIHPFGGSQLRAHETIDIVGRLFSELDPSDQLTWNYRNELDSDDQRFSSWEQKYGPHPQGPGNDTYTSLTRWDLQSPRIPNHSGGIWITGYGKLSNVTSQPFRAQDIVLVTDGTCSSTCAIFSEFLRQEAGVKSISLGGCPSLNDMQSVGGTKGVMLGPWYNIFATVQGAVLMSLTQAHQQDLNHTALAEYSYLPLARGRGSVNLRNGIRRNDNEKTPYQFLYEPAECKVFYTKQMVMDQSVVWKTVADTVWGEGNACVAGDDSFSNKQGNLTAESGERRHKMWDVRHDFNIEEAWKGLKVETNMNWFGGSGDCVMIR